jgi:hypothetical protein
MGVGGHSEVDEWRCEFWEVGNLEVKNKKLKWLYIVLT